MHCCYGSCSLVVLGKLSFRWMEPSPRSKPPHHTTFADELHASLETFRPGSRCHTVAWLVQQRCIGPCPGAPERQVGAGRTPARRNRSTPNHGRRGGQSADTAGVCGSFSHPGGGVFPCGERFTDRAEASPRWQRFLLVTSSRTVNDPFLDLVLDASWSAGRLVRNYTILLDPPVSHRAPRKSQRRHSCLPHLRKQPLPVLRPQAPVRPARVALLRETAHARCNPRRPLLRPQEASRSAPATRPAALPKRIARRAFRWTR